MSNASVSKIDLPFNKNIPGCLYPHLFYSPKWLDVLGREYDFSFFQISDDSNENHLIVALIKQFGFFKVKSLPFCDYTIPSVKNSQAFNALINKVTNYFSDIPIELTILVPDAVNRQALDFELNPTAYCHRVDTSVSMDEVENNMDNSFRRGVRKAQSHDLKTSISKSKKSLSDFYRIYYKQRIEKFGKIPQPCSFFEKVRKNFMQNGDGFILQVEKDETIIASVIILAHTQKLYYKFGCSLPKFLDYRPNNLLFYRLFEYAQARNIPEVDLGLSGVSKDYEGLVRFKEYMGGVAANIYSVRITPPGYDSSVEDEINKFTSSLTTAITKQELDQKSASTYGRILYPYFA